MQGERTDSNPETTLVIRTDLPPIYRTVHIGLKLILFLTRLRIGIRFVALFASV
jgi:hypothetical protein